MSPSLGKAFRLKNTTLICLMSLPWTVRPLSAVPVWAPLTEEVVASGLEAALRRLGLSHHEVVAIGNDANDHGFLDLAECGVAVATAVPSLKARAAVTTKGGPGEGVIELIEELVSDDLRERTAVQHVSRDSGRVREGFA